MKKNELRQKKVLFSLIEEYIKSSNPISSGVLCKKYFSTSSAATTRIDLAKLEGKGYIFQPHISSGRIPTILGYREYLKQSGFIKRKFANIEILKRIVGQNFRDTNLMLQIIMKFLTKETNQLSFVAEPEMSYGFLKKLSVLQISKDKLLFVVSLDSGLDKTIIAKCDYQIKSGQLEALVRYVNTKFVGLRIYDIQSKYLLTPAVSEENNLLSLFLKELYVALGQMSGYLINFDGSISFLEQCEFDNKKTILSFFGMMQRQDLLVNLMQENGCSKGYNVLIGEDLLDKSWGEFALIYARYHLFGIPGFLGILAPIRSNYKKNISIVYNFAKVITQITKELTIAKY